MFLKLERVTPTLSVGIVFLGLACASKPPVDPVVEANSKALTVIHFALDESESESDDQPTYRFAIRLNPPKCECPEVEILYKDEWHRVFVTAETEADIEFQELVEQLRTDFSQGKYTVYFIDGRLVGEVKVCGVGHRHPILSITVSDVE